MSWLKLDDTVPEHPKVLTAGPEAAWLWVCGIAYAQRHLSDGFLPQAALPVYGACFGAARAKKLAERLVAVGLFDATEGGYRVHDYHDHNAPATAAKERRASLSEARRAAGRVGGRRSADMRRGEANAKQTGSKPEATAGSKPEAPSHPIPDAAKNAASGPLPARGRVNGRIFLHPWQFQELSDLLGPHLDAFALDEWLDALSRRADDQGLTFESKELRWAWVLSELRLEIERRGLPTARPIVDSRRPGEPRSVVPDAEETRRRMAALRGQIQ